jgi:hypothetical protein
MTPPITRKNFIDRQIFLFFHMRRKKISEEKISKNNDGSLLTLDPTGDVIPTGNTTCGVISMNFCGLRSN